MAGQLKSPLLLSYISPCEEVLDMRHNRRRYAVSRYSIVMERSPKLSTANHECIMNRSRHGPCSLLLNKLLTRLKCMRKATRVLLGPFLHTLRARPSTHTEYGVVYWG